MIQVRQVCKAYRTADLHVDAVRNVDLTIPHTGFHAIMGPSGSGKSTLLHLLAGLDRPDAGEIVVNGERVHALSERRLTLYRRRSIGVVFQRFNLLPTMSALDNVALPARLDGQSAAQARRRASTLLESLGLAARAGHRPDALSGGEQQRVAIARALVFDPPVLLADEPTGNLDSATAQQIWHRLRRLADERDITVVMVTHEPDAAAQADHIHVMRDGRIADDFEVADHDPRWVARRYQSSTEPASTAFTDPTTPPVQSRPDP